MSLRRFPPRQPCFDSASPEGLIGQNHKTNQEVPAMIQLRSILEVADNTGARKAAYISRKGQKTDTAGVGDIVTVHIKESTTDATVKKAKLPKRLSFAPVLPCAVRTAVTFVR
jgi:flagellar basal body L-ring protein FlgH